MAKNSDERLRSIEDRIGSIETQVRSVAEGLKTVEKNLHGVVVTLRVLFGVLVLIFGAVVGIVGFTGKSVIRDIAREVFREEQSYLKTVVRGGRFSERPDDPSQPLVLNWPLDPPVDPDAVITAIPGADPMPAGVMMTAEITDNGRNCRMTLSGSAEAINSVSFPLEAWVTITTRR